MQSMSDVYESYSSCPWCVHSDYKSSVAPFLAAWYRKTTGCVRIKICTSTTIAGQSNQIHIFQVTRRPGCTRFGTTVLYIALSRHLWYEKIAENTHANSLSVFPHMYNLPLLLKFVLSNFFHCLCSELINPQPYFISIKREEHIPFQ